MPDAAVDPLLLRHLRGLRVDTVIDVGANEGQYGRLLRAAGFRGRIVSFEPLPQTFEVLLSVSRRDRQWDCHQLAIGDRNDVGEMSVSQCSVFSSFLPIRSFVHDIQPPSRTIGRERVQTRTLDSIFPELRLDGQIVWLKSDTQGFELQVLRGADRSLARFRAIQLEMSIRALYDNQPTIETMLRYMWERGFVLSALLQGFADEKRWELMEVDGIFVNSMSGA